MGNNDESYYIFGQITEQSTFFYEDDSSYNDEHLLEDESQFGEFEVEEGIGRRLRDKMKEHITSDITDIDSDDDEKYKAPRGKSIAHEYFVHHNLVWFSFDIERIISRIVQISCQAIRLHEDSMDNVETNVEPVVFNKHVKPPGHAI